MSLLKTRENPGLGAWFRALDSLQDSVSVIISQYTYSQVYWSFFAHHSQGLEVILTFETEPSIEDYFSAWKSSAPGIDLTRLETDRCT